MPAFDDGSQLTGRPTERSIVLLDISILWRRKGTITLSVLACVALGFAYLQQATPVFESEARVLVQQQDPLNSSHRVRTDEEFLATQAEIIRSPVIIEKALETVKVNVPAGSKLDPVFYVLKGLRVTPIQKTNVLNISFRGPDREQADRLVTTIISCYSDYLKSTEAVRTSDSLKLMRQSEENLRSQMAALQQKHEQLRKESPQIGQGHDAMTIPMARLREIGNQLAQTSGRRMDLENRLRVSASLSKLPETPATLRKADSALADGTVLADASASNAAQLTAAYPFTPGESSSAPAVVISLQDNTTVATADPVRIQEQLWKAKAQALDLAQVYGPRHPEVRALNQQIVLWERRLVESQANTTAAIAVELEALKVAEQDLSDRYQKEMNATRELDTFIFREQQMIDEIRRVEAAHKTTLEAATQMDMAAQALDGGQGSILVRILESPELVENRVWPMPAQFIGLCAVIGFLGSSVLLVLFQRRLAGATTG